MKQIVAKLWSDESGTETVEYAFIMGLIVVGAIAIISQIGVKVVRNWNGVKAGL